MSDVVAETLIVERAGEDCELAVARYPRDQELVIADHLLFAIEMFAGLNRLLITEPFAGLEGGGPADYPEGSPWRFRFNAVLETYISRARMLDEFIYKDEITARNNPQRRQGRKMLRNLGDVVSVDFVREPRLWLNDRPARVDRLKAIRDRTNRGVLHLSWARAQERLLLGQDPTQKTQIWEPGEIWSALRPALMTFLDHVRSDSVGADFLDRAHAALTNKSVERDTNALRVEVEARGVAIGAWLASSA